MAVHGPIGFSELITIRDQKQFEAREHILDRAQHQWQCWFFLG